MSTMKTILQFALAAIARLDMETLRTLWSAIERLVSGFEVTSSMTGAQKIDYVLERVGKMIPENRRRIAEQIIRAIVEIVLIVIRLKGGGE